MKKKRFNIVDHVSKIEIINKLNELGKRPLTKTGHGYKEFGSIPINQSSELSTKNYNNKSKQKPAISLIEVVLAANRNYNKVVEPNIYKIEKQYPNLKKFDQLQILIKSKAKMDFFEFWGHKDEKKYNTLNNILKSIEDLKKQYPKIKDDYLLLKKWGTDADLSNYKNDIIGSLPNIAIATFQHLRMVFGVDTIKPDQRVKEVLDYEFGLSKLSDIDTIKAVEQIANISNLRVITIDQIFVQYGSSYYNQQANKITIKQVISNLKKLGVENEIISKATHLTSNQIERII